MAAQGNTTDTIIFAESVSSVRVPLHTSINSLMVGIIDAALYRDPCYIRAAAGLCEYLPYRADLISWHFNASEILRANILQCLKAQRMLAVVASISVTT